MSAREFDYFDFLNVSYEECKNAAWFPDVLEACYSLDTDDLTVSAIVGEIHEGLRVNYDEAVKYFWTILLINPLIAIKAYQETDLLLGKIDVYRLFKYINPGIQGVASNALATNNITNSLTEKSGIYNTSIEYFMIFAMEALLQKDMNPEMLDAINKTYLGELYEHDKEIMNNKNKYQKQGLPLPAKWINHRNLNHILNAINPHHIIILLEFFADKYGARLRKGNVGKYCYSGDKYDYIIRFIKNKYGSLSEYIEWNNSNYSYHYANYFRRSLYYDEMFSNMDIIFPTKEDKERIEYLSGVQISDPIYRQKRHENRYKNSRF